MNTIHLELLCKPICDVDSNGICWWCGCCFGCGCELMCVLVRVCVCVYVCNCGISYYRTFSTCHLWIMLLYSLLLPLWQMLLPLLLWPISNGIIEGIQSIWNVARKRFNTISITFTFVSLRLNLCTKWKQRHFSLSFHSHFFISLPLPLLPLLPYIIMYFVLTAGNDNFISFSFQWLISPVVRLAQHQDKQH